ncbi:MAG TPA: signal peptidase I, partial [Solirubrobacteraceae bacterium]|nr:signal peptidase I [Solirubrobacteraceae bacterium]
MRRVLRIAVVAALIVTWVFTLRPSSLGGPLSVVVVSGNSMLPTFQPGSLVLAYRRGSYDVGDVIVYRVPKDDFGAGTRVIHRVVGGSAREGFRTRGDNRRTNDRWRPRPGDIEGLKLAALPDAGKAMMMLASPTSIAALLALMVFVSVGGKKEPKTAPRRRRRARVVRNEPVVAMWPPMAPSVVAPVEEPAVPAPLPFPVPAFALLPAPAPVALLPAPAPVALLPAPAPVALL